MVLSSCGRNFKRLDQARLQLAVLVLLVGPVVTQSATLEETSPATGKTTDMALLSTAHELSEGTSGHLNDVTTSKMSANGTWRQIDTGAPKGVMAAPAEQTGQSGYLDQTKFFTHSPPVLEFTGVEEGASEKDVLILIGWKRINPYLVQSDGETGTHGPEFNFTLRVLVNFTEAYAFLIQPTTLLKDRVTLAASIHFVIYIFEIWGVNTAGEGPHTKLVFTSKDAYAIPAESGDLEANPASIATSATIFAVLLCALGLMGIMAFVNDCSTKAQSARARPNGEAEMTPSTNRQFDAIP